ncbi:hypothetical protein GAYE_SCF08G3110 [Galdieria yellowstonensis]|uniref:Uncharacterized protein n=1 Tax=Galdieria yellowstonensis TaxID=3028027 RepID=A0AAV9ICR2_9RHOD|nr:hypothetical protein GAYE_SCF08G3110 [Galdieria yellowstonensis]
MGLCISKNAVDEQNTKQRDKTKTTLDKEDITLSTKKQEISNDIAEPGDNYSTTEKAPCSSKDEYSQTLSNITEDQKNQEEWKETQAKVRNVAGNIASLDVEQTCSNKQAMNASTKGTSDTSSKNYQSTANQPIEVNLTNHEKNHMAAESKLYKDNMAKKDNTTQKFGLRSGSGIETLANDATKTHVIKRVDGNSQVLETSDRDKTNNMAPTGNTEKEKTTEKTHVSTVQEKVRELELRLQSTRNASINLGANGISRNCRDPEAKIASPKRLSTLNPGNSRHQHSNSEVNVTNTTKEERICSAAKNTEFAVDAKSTENQVKNKRVRRNRDSLVRASTVFSSETLSNLIDMCSKERAEKSELQLGAITLEKEADEKSIEDSLIAKLKRTDSSPGVEDLSNEEAVKRWKYKNRQRKLRESRILWDTEEAIRGIRGSVLKAHASMKIFM